MFKIRGRSQKTLSQNFLYNRQLVKKLIGQTSFGKNDTILEIGPGKGIITEELLKSVGRVLAVEIDPNLVDHLLKNISDPNLIIFNDDFLDFPLPSNNYKVFSNIPFAVEGRIIRKLLDSSNPAEEIHLVVLADVGKRWVGIGKTSQFLMNYYPWFDLKIKHYFKRTDFIPKPRVDSILISITRKNHPKIPVSERQNYRQFIALGFGGGRRINTNLKNIFSTQKLNQLARKYGFRFNAKPSELISQQWLSLWQESKKN